uniref:Uncharacterized protein n=1 Tax=Utricularia reniformis TaxID=192314 RepID=A0A1Y0AZ39_9LAMI|nr:hypothetical protein AEK19_MT2021 [Utricularia reniformis]ART30425.1 hypothetical protein AEK19_MT2021 [Utricularia reniformis]
MNNGTIGFGSKRFHTSKALRNLNSKPSSLMRFPSVMEPKKLLLNPHRSTKRIVGFLKNNTTK